MFKVFVQFKILIIRYEKPQVTQNQPANSHFVLRRGECGGAHTNRCPLFRPQMPLKSIFSPSAGFGNPGARNALRGALKREIKIQRILTSIDFMSHRSRFYVAQILLFCHTETTEITEIYLCRTETMEITERYMSARF